MPAAIQQTAISEQKIKCVSGHNGPALGALATENALRRSVLASGFKRSRTHEQNAIQPKVEARR